MDAEYRKFLLQEKYDQHGKSLESLRKKKLNAFIQNEGEFVWSGIWRISEDYYKEFPKISEVIDPCCYH